MEKPVLLMTRPQEGSDRFVAELPEGIADRVDVVVSPLIQIVPVAVSGIDAAAAIFSSVHGVRYGPEGNGRRAFCVGGRTAEAALGAGWRVEVCARDADDLIAQMQGQPPGQMVHFAGRHKRGRIAERLCEMGHEAVSVTVYDQVLMPLSERAQAALGSKKPVLVPLFSPRTASQFAAEVQRLEAVHVVALSAAVAAEVAGTAVASVLVAAKPNANEMRKSIEILLSQASLT